MFSDYFDIYFFDDLALATLETVVISDSASIAAGQAAASGDALPVLAIAAPAGQSAASGTASDVLATVVDDPAGVATTSANVDLAISIAPPAGETTASADITPVLMVAAPPGMVTASGAIANIFIGPVVSVPAGQVTLSASVVEVVGLSVAASVTGSAAANIQIDDYNAVGAAVASASVAAISYARAAAIVRYYCTLTGAADGYADVTHTPSAR